MILGVTGNIASGKSTIARFFVECGALLLDADQLAREVVAPGSPLLAELVEHFGARALQADGSLDREWLAQRIFADPEARQQLNALLHPAIARLSRQRLGELDRADRLVIYESPLLYEAGAEKRVDQVLVVTVNPQVQLERLMARDGLDEAAARSRIAAQMPQAEKAARADYLIDNSGSLEQCQAQVSRLASELYSRIRGRSENR